MEDERMETNEFQLNDFPNEVLVMIFDRLPFKDLKRASLVCKRWRSLITTWCSNRFMMELYAPWLYPANFLQPIQYLKHLKIELTGTECPREMINFINWICDIAPHLITLHLDIPIDALERFFVLNLERLTELVLELDYCEILDTAKLQQFLEGIVHLRSLSVITQDAIGRRFSSTIFSLSNVENLTLKALGTIRLSGIENMEKLRKLEVPQGKIICPSSNDIQPNSPVKHLLINELNSANISPLELELERLFPNLTSLEITKRMITRDGLLQIGNTWPGLERLSIRICRLYGMTKALRRFPDLRWLKLEWCGKRFGFQSSYWLLNSLLGIRTLRQLHVRGHGDISIPDRNDPCKLYLNEQLLRRGK